MASVILVLHIPFRSFYDTIEYGTLTLLSTNRERDNGLTYNESGMTDQMLDLCVQRDSHIEDFLTLLIARLSDTIEEWEEFLGTEIHYFLYDGEHSTASPLLKESLIAISKEFSDLRKSRRKLEELKKKLSDGVAKGVSYPQVSHIETVPDPQIKRVEANYNNRRAFVRIAKRPPLPVGSRISLLSLS